MEELIDDLRAALDQMNRHLAKIAENTENTNQLLKKQGGDDKIILAKEDHKAKS